MNSKDNKNDKKESTNAAESKKQNEDFPNIPASSKRTDPPDIDKEDIEKASKNKTGKTDNTKK